MSKRIYYLSSTQPDAETTCEVQMRSQAYNTSTARLKKPGGTSVTIARTGENGEEAGSGLINLCPVGLTQNVVDSKLIFAHSLDLGYCTEEDWMVILQTATKDEYEQKFKEYLEYVKNEKWEQVFDILKLSIFYNIDGGPHGLQQYEYDYDDVFDYSNDGLVIVLAKAIQLSYQ